MAMAGDRSTRISAVTRRGWLRSGALAAGGGASAGSKGSSAPADSKKPITLRFIPAGFHADLDQLVVDQYHAENPHITISFEPQTGNYVDKITALQAGGDLQDVISVAAAQVK